MKQFKLLFDERRLIQKFTSLNHISLTIRHVSDVRFLESTLESITTDLKKWSDSQNKKKLSLIDHLEETGHEDDVSYAPFVNKLSSFLQKTQYIDIELALFPGYYEPKFPSLCNDLDSFIHSNSSILKTLYSSFRFKDLWRASKWISQSSNLQYVEFGCTEDMINVEPINIYLRAF
ncbi:unnamed protein product [Ambrosiozyma monospora]|uniref:Unnamed protein product n=1 Tax=Ambrosiozyma monospora TaxID=43982 RepID=A0ACB5U349_AMBMO|nr:unnamed protein product [Ambrosiozyma monospora]